MKKTFLKATLFSLLLNAVPAAMLTGCKDYDDDIDNLTQRDDELQKEINDKLAQQSAALTSQINALQEALDELKSEAARANTAAKAAADAAEAAQKTGDAALAAAQAANAEALAAQAAVAQAKADAIAETVKQVTALRNEINAQIDALKKEFGDKYDELSAALAKAATAQDLNSAVAALRQEIADSKLTQAEVEQMLSTYLSQINENTKTIAALSGKIDGIDTQLNTLSIELGNLKNQVDANTLGISQNTADIAANAANIAAETARINEIVNKTIPGIESSIADLDVKLDAHLAAYNTFKTQTEQQIAALEQFKATYENLLSGLSNEIASIKDTLNQLDTRLSAAESTLTQVLADLATKADATEITRLEGLITALQNKDDEHDAAISALQNAMTTVQQDINKINSALSTLNAINAKRLTSLTLVPTSYVGGIPTIEFYSASFVPMGQLDKATGIYAPAAADASSVIVTNNDTQVYYRMNPAGVSLSDVMTKDIRFIQQIAASRAANADAVIKVVDVNKNDDGLLVVTATKADGVTESIDNAGKGKIYTVALKVPVAPKNYYTWTDGNGKTVTEDAADAVVYSEYCRLSESTFSPEIAQAGTSPVSHFWGAGLWTATNVDAVAEVPYSYENNDEETGFDLTSLVAGCMNDNGEHTIMTPEQLASFGFTFEYSIPAKPYVIAGVDQQKFATVTSDGILTPVQPSGSAASRVGKTPIVSVTMKYGNQVVDQRFFKVEFVIDAKSTTFDIDVFEHELSCNGFTETVSWKELNELVIEKLGFQMTQAEFVQNYSLVQAVDGVTVNLNAVAPADPITWVVTLSDFAKMGGKDKDFVKTLKFKSDLFPEITVNLKGTVKWPATLPTLGAADKAYWTNGTMEILPLAMPVPYDGSTATYNTNILSGRPAPYLNNLLGCANWDVQIMAAPAGFSVGAAAPVIDSNDGYNIVKGGETAASLWYGDDHTPFSLTADDAKVGTDVTAMNFFIENNEAGIEMVENQGKVSLGWYIYLNGLEFGNSYSLNNTYLQIVRPLVSLNAGTIQPLTQDSKEQTRNLAAGMTITDCFKNTFAEGSDFWKYYGITNVKWLNNMTITDEDGSNERNLATLNLSAMVDEATGMLTFTGSGIALQQPIVLNVPVEVTHKWGVLKTIIKVTIKPGLN